MWNSKRDEPLRSGLRRGAPTSSKRDIPARPRASTQRRGHGRAARFAGCATGAPRAPAYPASVRWRWFEAFNSIDLSRLHRIGTGVSNGAGRARRARVSAVSVTGGAASEALGWRAAARAHPPIGRMRPVGNLDCGHPSASTRPARWHTTRYASLGPVECSLASHSINHELRKHPR